MPIICYYIAVRRKSLGIRWESRAPLWRLALGGHEEDQVSGYS